MKNSIHHNTSPPHNRTYRLRFTEEERADPELAPHIRKAEKAAAQLDQAKAKIPKKKVISPERIVDAITGKKTVRLRFEEIDKPGPPSKLAHGLADIPVLEAHRQINRVQDENVGVEVAHKFEQTAETGVRVARSIHCSRKLKPYRDVVNLEKRADQTNIEALYQKAVRQNPELQSNSLSRWQQKQAIKRQYVAAKKARQAAETTKKTTERTVKAAKRAAETVEKSAAFIERNWKPIMIILAIAAVVLLLMNAVSSCSMLMQGGMNMIVGTSYTSEDEDILAADTYYNGLESGLRQKIANIESTYPGYDEYRYDLAEIGHDPFDLTSYLTARYEYYTIEDVKPALDALFDQQYKLAVTEAVETRYRTETRTGSYTTTDPNTGATETHTYSYDVEVPYDYFILNVTLTNNALSRIASADPDAEKLELFGVYMQTQGNKPYLFEGNIYAYPGEYTDYEIPPDALANADFVALIAEAKKYLGYPYVWGGSNPSESFDCSGFVCWVLNQSGTASVGRTNARGLYGISTTISPGEAQPGDLIFFTGDRAAEIGHPVTHIGIYVGNGMMLHCASGGVQYSSINTPYWTKNFYAFGRLDG